MAAANLLLQIRLRFEVLMKEPQVLLQIAEYLPGQPKSPSDRRT